MELSLVDTFSFNDPITLKTGDVLIYLKTTPNSPLSGLLRGHKVLIKNLAHCKFMQDKSTSGDIPYYIPDADGNLTLFTQPDVEKDKTLLYRSGRPWHKTFNSFYHQIWKWDGDHFIALTGIDAAHYYLKIWFEQNTFSWEAMAQAFVNARGPHVDEIRFMNRPLEAGDIISVRAGGLDDERGPSYIIRRKGEIYLSGQEALRFMADGVPYLLDPAGETYNYPQRQIVAEDGLTLLPYENLRNTRAL